MTPAVDRSRRELSESSGIIEKGAFCVELWSFYCKKRISVPMSYIVVLERVGWGDGPVIKVIKSRCWFPFSNLLVQRQKGNCQMVTGRIYALFQFKNHNTTTRIGPYKKGSKMNYNSVQHVCLKIA